MATKIGKPKIDTRPEVTYMGIRIQTPFKGMFTQVDKLLKELYKWQEKEGVELVGPPFRRFHVIDMEGEMDIEVGLPVAEALPADGRIKPAVIPAGRYASLIFQGGGLVANKTLIEWARDNGLKWDRWDDPRGDGFHARYEAFLTDPKTEHRKSKWDVEVAIKLAEE